MKLLFSKPLLKPLVMGIINVTPDSFSGDGLLQGEAYIDHALEQARSMLESGADLLDIGGESSRPGSLPITAEEETRRVVPVINAICHSFKECVLAVDTVKASVAEKALEAGATIVNDISALTHDPQMAAVVKKSGAHIVLMHNMSAATHVIHDPKAGTHYKAPIYGDVVKDVLSALEERACAALDAGILMDKIILDPGIGFGKTPSQNLLLIKNLKKMTALGYPILVGVSRKSFIGLTLGTSVDARLEGTAACVTTAVLEGAHIVRVHDVAFMAKVVQMATALRDV